MWGILLQNNAHNISNLRCATQLGPSIDHFVVHLTSPPAHTIPLAARTDGPQQLKEVIRRFGGYKTVIVEKIYETQHADLHWTETRAFWSNGDAGAFHA